MMGKRLVIAMLLALAGGAHAGIDPGSASVAFVSIRTGDPQIWVRDSAGQERMLTQGKGLYTQPSLARDGRLAYVGREAGRPIILLLNSDGSEQRRLTEDSVAELAPSWSPDGKHLAYFALNLASGAMELRIRELAGNSVLRLSGAGKSMGPAAPVWSADGQRLAFVGADAGGRNQVWVLQSDGTGLREISSKAAPRGAAWADLSPDGERVVWAADLREKGMHIMLTELGSGETKDLSPGLVTGNESPRWSPDGRLIVFASARDDKAGSRSDIFVMNADGSEVRNLTRHAAEDFDPRWSSDGRRIVFASLRSGTSLLYEVDLLTGQTRALAQHGSHDMDHSVRPLALLRH